MAADETLNTSDVAQNDSSTASANTTTTQQVDTTDWKAKYNGLNGHAANLAKKVNDLTLKLAQATEQSEAEKLALSTEATTWKSKAVEHETAAQTAARERDALKARVEIGAVIRKDFPALAATYDKGLLNHVETMTPEARVEYLTTFNAEFGQLHETNVKKDVAGTTPNTAKTGRTDATTDTPATAQEKVNDYLRKGGRHGTPEYNALQGAYIQAIQNSALVK